MDAARYRELFVTEARDHLIAINQSLIALEQGEPGDQGDRGDQGSAIDALFRAVHTMKGMSGVMGYADVTALTHAMETRLALVRSGAEALEATDVRALFDAADALERAIEATEAGSGPEAPSSLGDARSASGDRAALAGRAAPSLAHRTVSAGDASRSALDVAALVARLQGGRRSEASGGDAGASAPGVAARVDADADQGSLPLPPGEGAVVEIRLEPGTALPGARAQLVIARARSLGAVTAVVPPESAMLGDDFSGAFALRLTTSLPDAEVRSALAAAGFVHEVRVTHPSAGHDVSRRFDAAWGSESLTAPLQRYVRIDLRRLDHLLSLVGELMVARGRLAQRAARHDDPLLHEAVDDAARLIGALQDGVLGGRMVPVWQVFDRFPRVVRDAARALGKDVEFTIHGREIELDRALLEQMADPLVHLLRNAIDHGIEAPAQRAAAGKRPTGRLVVSASRERSAVVIRVEDDGAGVDRARVLAKARAMGLVDEERDTLEDDEILRVIARAGFTTASRVTELSGRGVGIDAVVSKVRALGGAVDLTSLDGRGTTFTLRLPVTLAVIPALLARVGDETYALPLTHVTETLQRARGVVRSVRGREVIVIRGEVLPLLDLRALVGLPARPPVAAEGADAGAGAHVVLVAVAERRAGVVVDQLLGQEEIVVKPIDAVRGVPSCLNGATVMGDGSAALILEVGSLL